MNLAIEPKKLSGALTPPPSKSQAHRLIIAAALAKGVSYISNVALSEDIAATLNCMEALGAVISEDGSAIAGISVSQFDRLPVLDCGESGSTLRFLIPVALAVAGGAVFVGHGRLMERPMKPYETLFAEKGIDFIREKGQITVKGTLTAGTYALPGNVSSQFVTGLMYALPLLEGDSDIILTTPLESYGYVNLTLDALTRFGVTVEQTENGWHIPGTQRYQAQESEVERDYSQAAFYLAMNGIGSDITLEGLNPNTHQGDSIVLDYMEQLNGPGEVTLDVSQCPDLVPALAIRAALRAGEITHIVGAARLRLKESDRLMTVTIELNNLGGSVDQTPDSLTIKGVKYLYGGVCDSHNDHRIAMMLAAAATVCLDRMIICDAGCVAKSYPNFWDDYKALGADIREL